VIRGLLGQLLADPTQDVPPASFLGNAACPAGAAILSGSSAGSPHGHASARGRDSAQGKARRSTPGPRPRPHRGQPGSQRGRRGRPAAPPAGAAGQARRPDILQDHARLGTSSTSTATREWRSSPRTPSRCPVWTSTTSPTSGSTRPGPGSSPATLPQMLRGGARPPPRAVAMSLRTIRRRTPLVGGHGIIHRLVTDNWYVYWTAASADRKVSIGGAAGTRRTGILSSSEVLIA
jgi:hypothetical protein